MRVNKTLILLALVIVSVFIAGCGKKTPKATTAHHESGSPALITTEIYEECMANKDTQGAQDALKTLEYLTAFHCNSVNYEDAKNRNYNNTHPRKPYIKRALWGFFCFMTAF